MKITYNHPLNHSTEKERIEALKLRLEEDGRLEIKIKKREEDANNHVHTTFSFSPYSPTAAAYEAYRSGLKTCGIVDHDTLAGAEEFAVASRILGLAYTTGVELRVHFEAGKWGRMNNPDQLDSAYVIAHGIPARSIPEFEVFLTPLREFRRKRVQKMVDKINERFKTYQIKLDFIKDVYESSEAEKGGSITERHLMYALAKKLEEKYGRTKKLIEFLENELEISLSSKHQSYLLDDTNPYFLFDLLGFLKTDSTFFYIDAKDELPKVEAFIEITKRLGGIPAYAYLGDVTNSITGDKAPQTFEDSYLDLLVPELKQLGFEAIAYMPSRNTLKQLERLKALCEKYELMQISGEDINSPRQSFQCDELEKPAFRHLIQTTWALIGHERSLEKDPKRGLLTEKIKEEYPDLKMRLALFEKIGKDSVKDKGE
ncbi:MAG: hypothetical protein WC225_05075 [Acholeplasmataceae bacterium]|nr:hypothetical protein [Acholeplasmataceae bacterium]